MTSIFLHRRDLRIEDNQGLIKSLNENSETIPIFIFTQSQTIDNKYASNNSLQFMVQSLIELQQSYNKINRSLHLFYGDDISVFEQILEKWNIKCVYWNKDYTPYAKYRDFKLTQYLKKKNIQTISVHDYTLLPIDNIHPKNGKYYRIFSPFYKKVQSLSNNIPQPILNISNLDKLKNIEHLDIELNEQDMNSFFKYNKHLLIHGGRSFGLKHLHSLDSLEYNKQKSLIQNSSHLSPYIKFGNISIREAYSKGFQVYGKNSDFIKQLIWHDFYVSLINSLPVKDTIGDGNYKHLIIPWDNNPSYFKAWTEGTTGFPIIDAGIRQMLKTGWMHNKCRMIVANFLSLLLNVNWKWGEYFFAIHLVDYDLALNNGNWQWSTQVGIDNPRFYPRIFNPWTYSAKHDPEAIYIKKWIPELSNIPPKHIHKWNFYSNNYKDKITYPSPIIDYSLQRKNAIERYRNSSKYS